MPEIKFRCPHCWHNSASWNTELNIGYCFLCQKAVKRALNLPGNIKKTPKTGVFDVSRTTEQCSSVEQEILENDWGIPENDQKRLIFSGKMMFLDNFQVGFRCEGGSLTQWRSLLRSQKGWIMKFSTSYRETTIFLPFDPLECETVILTEGILDAIRVAQAVSWGVKGIVPVAILGVHIGPVALKYLKDMSPQKVFTWFDPDTAGVRANDIARKKLPRFKFPVVEPIFSELEPADLSILKIEEILCQIGVM